MNKCIICDRLLSKKILRLTNMPQSAQNMPDKDHLEKDEGIELSLYECPGCGLIQFDAPPVSYYRDVIRATKVSKKFYDLRLNQYKQFVDRFQLEGKKILEVGCGAGEFLEIWENFPVHAYGIEHNRDLVNQARKNSLNVIEGFIENENDIVENGPFDAFISLNFLEHQPNPKGMLIGIYENLKEEGVGLITVPSFEYFQEKASYYEFLRDHIAYYTQETLTRLLEITGFEMISCSRFNNDTLEVLVKKRKKKSLVDYMAQKDILENQLNQYLEQLNEKNIFIWGASHQAFCLLATLNMIIPVSAVIDSAVFKWDKYTPASHIKIVSPDILRKETPECIIIMAPGFADEIFAEILSINNNISKILSVKDGRVEVLLWID